MKLQNSQQQLIKLFSLEGKVAFVTGSSGGLGLAIAVGLAEAGATIILNGRDATKLELAVQQLQHDGFDVYGRKFDVTIEEQVKRAILEIEKNIGVIDVLVNNAGITRRGTLETIIESDFQAVLNTNLIAPFLMSKHIVNGMMKKKAGKIINICSVTSELGRQTNGAYSASKGGLKMLTKSMAVDWARYNIQVNGIGPGYFITELTKVLADDSDFDAWLKSRTPAGRWGDPSELVGTAIYLASAASNFVNGQIIYVDGGLLASV
jgi:gluconate 5-dehydrogenase